MVPQAGSAYLDWITRHFGRVGFNLAASGTPGLGIEELAQIAPLWSPDPTGRLAAEIARLYGLNPHEVLACNGASQALWLGYAVTLRPGEEALVETPAYAPFADLVTMLGGRLRRFEWGTQPEAGLDSDRICAMIEPQTRVVALSHLHNPTGRAANKEALLRIAGRLAEQDGFLILNEIYADFTGAQATRQIVPCESRRQLADNVIVVSSMSKAYGLGALRIGWLAAPKSMIERGASAMLATTGDMSPAWAATASGALAELPRLGARAAQDLADKRQMVDAWMARQPDLVWSEPDGGLFGLAGLPPGTDDLALVERAISQFDLIVAPGRFFNQPSSIRLAWSCRIEILEEGLKRLEQVLAQELTRP